MTPYPATIPAEDMMIVAGLLGGNVPDPARAIHAGWDTVGWILGTKLPDPVPFQPSSTAAIGMKAPHAAMAPAHAETMARHLANPSAAMSATTFDWQGFLLALLQALAGSLGK